MYIYKLILYLGINIKYKYNIIFIKYLPVIIFQVFIILNGHI